MLVLFKTHTESHRSLVRNVSSLQKQVEDRDGKAQEEIALLRGSIESVVQRQRELQQQVSAPKLPARNNPISTNYHEFISTLHGVTFKYLTTTLKHQGSIAEHIEREKEGYVILKGAVTEHKDPSPAFVMDIGSNHGLYALFAATLGSDVIALEPQHKYFEVVRAAAHLNGVGVEDHIQVYNYGVLDTREIVTMADHQINEGGIGRLVVGEKTDNNPTAVETRFIDDFMPNNPSRAVDFLKVDVEGFEIKALRSAKKLFGDSKGRVRNVLVEFGPPSRWERSGNSAADGVTLLREMRDNYGFEPRIMASFAFEPFQKLVPGAEEKSAYGATYMTVSGDSEIDMLVEAMRKCNCEAYVWFASTVVFELDKSA